jgi:long-chain acyl-CoA synthetase
VAAALVLVTGGTGAIGLPLVEAFARDGIQAAVLARRPDAPVPGGVRVVTGDVTAGPRLGLGDSTWRDLRERVTAIVHGAALTRFDAPLEAARGVNVAGTGHVLAFAANCPQLQKVVALSTVYVAGRRTGPILETDLEHDRGFVNPYEQSKHEAERLLRSAMPTLPIAVARLSTAIGDSASGLVERPAAIHHAIRFLYHSLLPMIPGADGSPVDLVPTDYVVAAIRALVADRFEAGATWHVCGGEDAVREDELIDLVVEAFIRYRPAWRRRAIEKPAIVALETFELFRQSVDAVADPGLRASVAVLAPFAPQLAFPKTFGDERCRVALAKAGVTRPPVRATIDRVVRYLVENNWAAGREAEPWPA